MDKEIEVNDPLSYDGIRFYQSSYGQGAEMPQEVSLSISGPGLPDSGYIGTVPFGQDFSIPGTGLTLNVSDFLPDFVIDMETGRATTRSGELNNPAFRALIFKNTDTLYRHWVFFNFPDQHARNEQYRVTAISVTPRFYTGIQVRKNPGVPLIWIGIIAMTFGIFAVFYLSKRSIWIFIEPVGGGSSNLSMGGSSNRAGFNFEKEFSAIGKCVQATLKQDI
jgi:cytochrome c biogenesis protein